MKPRRCSWSCSLYGGAAAVMQAEHHLQDHRARLSEEVRWWSCSLWYSESLCQLVFEGDRRVSHGCRSGLAVDDKADTATAHRWSGVRRKLLLLLSTTNRSIRGAVLGRSVASPEAAMGSGDAVMDGPHAGKNPPQYVDLHLRFSGSRFERNAPSTD